MPKCRKSPQSPCGARGELALHRRLERVRSGAVKGPLRRALRALDGIDTFHRCGRSDPRRRGRRPLASQRPRRGGSVRLLAPGHFTGHEVPRAAAAGATAPPAAARSAGRFTCYVTRKVSIKNGHFIHTMCMLRGCAKTMKSTNSWGC